MYSITFLDGTHLTLESGSRLFSPYKADSGTLAMLSFVTLQAGDKVLDLGGGSGLVGIWAAKHIGQENVVMCDISAEAVGTAAQNAAQNGVPNTKCVRSDGFDALDDVDFSYILCNPPYHSDFAVAKRFIEKGFNRLRMGGKLVMVVKRRLWYQNKITAIFGGARVAEKDGYFVITGEKRSMRYASK